MSVDDIKTLIMSIVKITDYKRINIQPTVLEAEQIEQHQVGFFNMKSQFCIRPEDLPIIYKQFDLLAVNRI